MNKCNEFCLKLKNNDENIRIDKFLFEKLNIMIFKKLNEKINDDTKNDIFQNNKKFTIKQNINLNGNEKIYDLSSYKKKDDEKYISRVEIQKMINLKKIYVNQKVVVKKKYLLQKNDFISIDFNINDYIYANIQNNFIKNNVFSKENDVFLKINIIYDDEYIAVIDKPINLTMHPGAGTSNDTLVHFLCSTYGSNLSFINTTRPGILHRLDRNTSGLVIITKTNFAHYKMNELLQNRKINRYYYAIISGCLKKNEIIIKNYIKRDQNNRKKMKISQNTGKLAITRMRKIFCGYGLSFVECKLDTGRTHQIRAHMNYINHSILGDIMYGWNYNNMKNLLSDKIKNLVCNIDYQMLHAHKLSFFHPFLKKKMIFHSKIPYLMQEIIKEMKL